MPFRLALAALALILATSACAQDGWRPVDAPFGATYRSDSGATLHVLPLTEADRVTGYDLSDLDDDFALEVLDYTLGAYDLSISDVEGEDARDPRRASVWGLAETADGTRRVAAALRGDGAERRVVILVATPDAYASVGGREALDLGLGASGPSVARLREDAPDSPVRDVPPAPSSWADVSDWSKPGLWRLQSPGDPASPRWAGIRTDPGEANTFDEALDVLVGFADLDPAGGAVSEEVDAWRRIDGRRRTVSLMETRYGGGRGVAFVVLERKPGSLIYEGLVMEMPMHTFVAWGGITRMLLLRGVTPAAEVFPADRRDAIARSSFKSQLDLYEAASEALYSELAAQAVMTQQAVTLRLMELNYDLILGGDISSPYIAD